MAKQITFSEAVTRFGPLISTNISAEDAIREAFLRIYELGRWPGTTKEISFVDGDFTQEGEEWFLYLDEKEYDGMIGFRNKSRGWSIMDSSILYKDGVNGGDLALIDFGSVEVEVDSDFFIRRKYRMPLGFSVDSGPYYALMKLEAPYLADDTLLPIHSIGAIKCAIMAVSYEMVSDDDRANLNWQKFDQFMKLSERQVEGPKRYFISMDSSLRRKPQQFM